MVDKIAISLSIQEITDCFPVMKELRSHLELADFIVGVASRNENRVRRQQQQFDYQLVYLQVDEKVRAVAGFRISESL
jgi:hypothetical protein